MNADSDPPSTLVVKISGSLLDDASALTSFWRSVARLRETARVVVVHGGGKQMTSLSERMGHAPRFVQGRRVTTDLDLDVARWALRGEVNTRLVAQASQHGLVAVGLSGADGTLLHVSKRPAWTVDGETVDFGWVGDVEGVETSVLVHLLDAGIIPVVAPLGIDDAGQVYNVNADTVARALASALDADQLLLVTGTGGVRRDKDAPDSRLDTCDAQTFSDGVDDGWIDGGMRVKLETALEAVRSGVGQAFICGATDLIDRRHATQVVG